MKPLFTLLIASSIATGAIAQNVVDCPFTSITSDITTNTTLSASTLYRIEDCIHVTSGATLTIPAGTKVMFEKSSNAGLNIDKGAYLIVEGTSGSPVVFTSDQEPGQRNRGDYSGLVINGKATNNFSSNAMTTENRTCNVDAGGTNDNDSSGVVKFLRIEYAEHGLTLASVGRKTVIENIMVSYPEMSAYEFLGGTAQAKRLIALNAKENDFVFNYGNRSKVQQAFGLRLDAAANYGSAPNSNGILIANNDNAGSSYAGTPQTRPVLDKFTLLGPAYCGGTGLSSNFKNAVLAYHNAQLGMYHSVLSSWPTGFRIEDASTLTNATASPQLLKFEANSFDNNTTDYSHNGTWVTGSCASDIVNWMTNVGACSQRYNEFSPGSLGYDASICDDYCTSNIPSFLVSGSDLGSTQYGNISELNSDAFFTTSSYRGAFDATTDWTADWTAFCPQEKDYCPSEQRMGGTTGINKSSLTQDNGLVLSPNPGSGLANAAFTSGQAGLVDITVVNGMGQVVRSFTKVVTTGKQKINLNTEGLATGMYILRLNLPEGKTLQARILLK